MGLTRVLLPGLVTFPGRAVPSVLEMLEHALLQLEQRLGAADLEARMPRALGGHGLEVRISPEGDVDLLAARADVKPCQGALLQLRYLPRRQAERRSVELVGLVKSVLGYDEIDVVQSRDEGHGVELWTS